MAQNYFFMVYASGHNNPVFRHQSLASAESEARRLAETLGVKTYVLTTIKSVELVKYHVEDCRPEMDLPF